MIIPFACVQCRLLNTFRKTIDRKLQTVEIIQMTQTDEINQLTNDNGN